MTYSAWPVVNRGGEDEQGGAGEGVPAGEDGGGWVEAAGSGEQAGA